MARLKIKRLKKGLYFTRNISKEPLFGLRNGQMRYRKHRISKNAGWYNLNGEKIGIGDLEPKDLQRIAQELKDYEMFIVLSEYDSHLRFRDASQKHWLPKGGEVSPGVRYVSRYASWVIIKGRVYKVTPIHDEANQWRKRCKVRFKRIHTDVAVNLIKNLRKLIRKLRP